MDTLSDSQKERIKKEAQDILEKFGKALASLKIEKKKNIKAVGGFREESQGNQADPEFRQILFKNAPNKNRDCIIAEKKKW